MRRARLDPQQPQATMTPDAENVSPAAAANTGLPPLESDEALFKTDADHPPEAKDLAASPSKRIVRFLASERAMHWAIAVPFLILMASAAVLVLVYNPHPHRPYREIVSLVHRIAGVLLISLPLVTLIAGFRQIGMHLRNVKEAWFWTFDDIKWLMLMPFAVLSKKVKLPEEGKFNAGEKLNFMMVTATYPLFSLTGVAIWGGYFGAIPWLAHIALAVMATPLVFGHMYMAMINPASRKGLSGVFSGMVDRAWASHHYRRWFRENFAHETVAARADNWRRKTLGDWVLDGGETVRHQTGPGLSPTPMGDGKRERSITKSTARAVVKTGLSLTPATGFFAGVFGAALFAAGAYLASPSRHSTAYVVGEQALRLRPAPDAASIAGAPLTDGTAVILIEQLGDFGLVRDASGRVGYLAKSVMSDEEPAPPAAPVPPAVEPAAVTPPVPAPAVADTKPGPAATTDSPKPAAKVAEPPKPAPKPKRGHSGRKPRRGR
ncbi:MAG: cytochrome b/b6 domain-containing protein [Deltaproteobacteria bacterium]|nr:cytochrome b/b6 domain-containing protein [Deltaproteobacteria bacterium]